MKSVIAAASALAVAAIAAPAFAQDSFALAPVGGYFNLGYANADTNGLSLNTLGGRAGVQFGKYLGAEGELQLGIGNVDTDSSGSDVKLRDAYAAYLVGHLPLTANGEVFVRGGLGHTMYHDHVDGALTNDEGYGSWNFGGGAQYFFTAHQGIRIDYTREEFRDHAGHANVWGASWVYRFH